MKKIIIGLSGLIILAFAVILFTNAQSTKREVKKVATEVTKNCTKCPSSATCAKMTETKATSCDMSKCKDAKCDMTKCKEAKCDPATCKTKCAETKGEMKNCDQSKCQMKSATK